MSSQPKPPPAPLPPIATPAPPPPDDAPPDSPPASPPEPSNPHLLPDGLLGSPTTSRPASARLRVGGGGAALAGGAPVLARRQIRVAVRRRLSESLGIVPPDGATGGADGAPARSPARSPVADPLVNERWPDEAMLSPRRRQSSNGGASGLAQHSPLAGSS